MSDLSMPDTLRPATPIPETRVYLDHNASAPLRPEAATAMVEAMALSGNPSSVHKEGRALRGLIDRCRADVAALAGCEPGEVIFTSGATEANAQALSDLGPTTIASGIEHLSVYENTSNSNDLKADSDGVIQLDHLAELLEGQAAAVGRLGVAIMAANNETGVLQPIAPASALCRKAGALLHVDAVQAAGKIDLTQLWPHADMMSLSAHKIGGGRGVGALIVRDGLPTRPLIAGGGQELRRRGGTENVAGIAAFGVAARLAAEEIGAQDAVARRRDRLEAEMRTLQPAVKIYGANVGRLPNTTCAAVPGVPAEVLLMRLDLAGIAVSAGSACSSGKVAASPVLSAMGVPEAEARCAIRISQGLYTTDGDIDRFLAAWQQTVC